LIALGATGYTLNTSFPGLPIIAANFVASTPSFNAFPRHTMDFSEDILHMVGKHQISFGVEYCRIGYKENNLTCQNGVAIFAGVASSIAFGGLNNNTFADLYMGMPLIWIQSDGFFVTSKGNMLGFYGEDSIARASG
jgi:hypothetical protein